MEEKEILKDIIGCFDKIFEPTSSQNSQMMKAVVSRPLNFKRSSSVLLNNPILWNWIMDSSFKREHLPKKHRQKQNKDAAKVSAMKSAL